MFKSKKDVDAHVRDVFSKCKSENERLKLCYGIAKQYCGIREFDSARRYLETYLNSDPTNLAESNKLMGDIHLELGDSEKALESYKISYSEGKARDSLNRVCDLLARGFGSKETAESKKTWFDMQKSSVNNNPLSSASSTGSSPVVPRRTPINLAGPPKTGFSQSSFTNGSPGPLVSSASKTNGNGVDLQLRYLERRFDDGLGKILDQNTLVLEQMLKLKDEVKKLSDKVEDLSAQNGEMQSEIRDLRAKQEETHTLALENKQNPTIIQQMIPNPVPVTSCTTCVGCQTSHTGHAPSLKPTPSVEPPIQPPPTFSAPPPQPQPAFTAFPVHSQPTFTLPSVQSQPAFTAPQPTFTATPATQPQPAFTSPPTQPPPSFTAPPTQPPPAFTEPSAQPQPAFSFGLPSANSAAATAMPNLSFSINNSQPSYVTPVNEQRWPQQTVSNVPVPTLSPATVTVVDSAPAKKSDETKESPFVGMNMSGKFSFADLAKNNNPSTPSFSFGMGSGNTGTTAFNGAGTPLFNATISPNVSTVTTSSKANVSAHADETEDDFVPTAEFQPVIPLPPLVEVKKGDENENTIAEYRAKLYRFITESKEWKERGVGNVKLLQSKEDPTKCRVVMWREKIGKLACNFNLFPDIKVTNYQNNPKVLCWKCQDSAEDISWETFTLRFGNEDNCKHFKEEMERLAKLTVASTGESPPRQADKPQVPTAETNQVPLSQLVKKPEGSWNCNDCYSQNDKDSVSCAACQSVRPGYESSIKPVELPATLPKFSFGFPTANTSATTPNLSFSINNTQSFGSTPVSEQQKPQQSVPATVVDSVTPKKSDESKDAPFAGLNLSGKFSFADLAKTNSTPNFSFGIGTGSTGNSGFSGAGTQLFNSTTSPNSSSVTTSSKANTTGNADETEDDFVPTAEFQPVIPLPPLVEVKKGDENENTIAEYRAKLYRFITESKEWKERGVGNVKLLQSKEDPTKCRVVMWREKIGKLACNFNLFPDIKVTNYQNNPKVLCWKCQDSAEDISWETFTLRFGNEDNCKHFKEEMERLAKLTVVSSGESPPRQVADKPEAPKTETNQVPLSQLVKKPEGSWNCDDCYSQNNKDSVSCAACQSVRPGYESSIKPVELPATLPKFTFGFPTANTSATTPNLSFSINNTQSFASTPASEQQNPQQIIPGTVVDSVTPKKSDESKDAPFAGLNLSGKFSFADLAKTDSASAPNFSFGIGSGNTSSSAFSGAGTPLFNSSSSFANNTTTSSVANTSGNADETVDDFVPTAEFQPVIPLPPLVEVKKGDENENTIAEYRAKLYRFIAETKEWKERGVGNVKLLQSKEDDRKCRVVMWREKIGKLACNFSLFPNFTVTNYQNNPKVLCWKCQDYAEEPSSWETFTLRFGNEDNCKHFKEEMERLAKLTVASSGESPPRQGADKAQVPKTETNQIPLSQLIQKPEGSWSCNDCYSSNNKDAVSCAACQAVRPGYESSIKPVDLPATLPTFKFGFSNANAVSPPNGEEKSSCSGCIGCNPENYTMPEVKVVDVKEEVIGLPLAQDSSSDVGTSVTLGLFTSSSANSKNDDTSQLSQGSDSSVSTESKTATNATFPNFSFSMQTPEKAANPISFQFKNPSFSFKSPDGSSSIFGGGSGSIFSSPTGGNAASGTPSPFVSPFAQTASLNNSTSSPSQPPPFSFSQNLFTQQSPVESANNEEVYEQQEDGEYEDVEDEEEEDECMLEEDARVYIKDDTSGPEDFSDKGEATVRVLYDGESYCARLVITNDGEIVAEHLVAAETLIEPTGELTYEWIGICNYDAPKKSRIRAVFSNEEAFKNFSSVMADSLEFAEQAGITEAELLDQNVGGY